MENEREDKGYNYDDLVKIGDHIHDSKTAIIVSDIEHPDGTHTTLGSAVGKRGDIIQMLYNIMKGNKEMEDLISEAVLMRKMQNIAELFSKMNGDRGGVDNANGN